MTRGPRESNLVPAAPLWYFERMSSLVERVLGSHETSDRNVIREAWDRLHRVPGGRIVFSRLIGTLAPYTATIRATVLDLRTGHSEVAMDDRRSVRNHIRCVHAIALANLAELTGNVAVAYTLPPDGRFIVAGIELDYRKKARGTITGYCDCPIIESSERREYQVPVVLRDSHGEEVVRAHLRTLVGPKRKEADRFEADSARA
jgi:acyl-coenzyme A thioesterase PaaI-like protein